MSKERESLGLPPMSAVGRYQLLHIHHTWGFYITYMAEVDGTARRALVHELVPEELVERAADGSIQGKSGRDKENFAWARERFLKEGRALAACSHPAIQKVTDIFEANNTGYWVTATDEPRDLKIWLERFGRAPNEAELTELLSPLLSALQQLHAAGLQHLNLKFDTIRIAPDGKPILVHFAGARQDIARHSHESAAVTTGYAPIEQYDDTKTEGPWTDIYSLAAVLHRLIAGQLPPEATERLTSDPYQKLAARFAGKYRAEFLSAIDAALAVDPTARPQNIEGWRKMLGISAAGASGRRSTPALVPVFAAIFLVVVAAGGWYLFRPKSAPPIKKDIAKEDQDQKDKDAEQKKAEEEKKKREEEKKAEEAKAAEEKRKAEAQKLAEAARKAEEETKAAERAAQDKAAAAKEADAAAREKEEAAKTAEEKAESKASEAAQAADKVGEAKGAAKKKAAERDAADAAAKAAEAQREADTAAAEKAATNVAARQAELDEASAEKAAAEKDLAQKSIEQQIAALPADPKSAEAKAAAEQAAAAKAAAEKTATERTVAEKEAADKLASAIAAQKALAAKKSSDDKTEKEKSPDEKAAAEKAAEKAAAEKAATEKAAAEMAAKKAAEEKAAAEKAAAEKAAADKAAELAKKEHDKSSQNQNGPPPPPPPSGGQVGSGLGGVWETTQKDASGKPLKRLIIYPDAHFELFTDSGKMTGFIQAKLGIISLAPDNSSDALHSTFIYKSMSVIETDVETAGVLGKFEWTRVSANTPDRDSEKGK